MDAPTPEPRKRRDITEAAAVLFRDHGVRRVSVEEICAAAQVSKGTFYKYFPNKTELVKHIFVEMSDGPLSRAAALEHLDIPFHEKVRRIIDERLEATRRTSEAFIQDFYHADAELAAFIDALMAENQRRFLEFIVAAQRRGDMRPEVKPAFVLAILAKLHELAGDDGLRAHYADYHAFMREVVDFFFYGLLTAPSLAAAEEHAAAGRPPAATVAGSAPLETPRGAS